MADSTGNLHLYEAIELRSEYDRHITLIQAILDGGGSTKRGFLGGGEDEEKVPADDLDREEMAQVLKSLQRRRVKLNQAVQLANFEVSLEHNGSEISLAEALEVRKNLLADLDAVSKRVERAAYKRVIHKEERDIVYAPKQPFKRGYDEYRKILGEFRSLITKIHIANHANTVRFKAEQ